MLFVAVIVIIAFTFFYDAGRGPDREKNSKLFSIDGKNYTLKDYEKILMQLSMVYQLRSMDYFNFANQITSVRTDKEQRGMAQAFAYNLTILRNRSKSLGIYVSNEEVVKEIERMDIFQVRDTMGQPLNRFNLNAWEYFKSTALAGDFTEKDFAQLIKDKITILKNILGDKISDIEMDLMVLLMENGHMMLFGEVVKRFDYLKDKDSEIIKVQITSSSRLSDDEVQRISLNIENKIQKKVDVTMETDTSIVGGIKLRVGNTLIDGSVSNHLQKIRDTLIQV